jgi:hypothetical protein
LNDATQKIQPIEERLVQMMLSVLSDDETIVSLWNLSVGERKIRLSLS